ncbi:MAG: hypothetical protein ETSY1_11555 [Candidatus Entotheonella factor]|uniref:Zinc-regulated TonB-dependent outer membrane receptor n=1 Tax=Entotheonella factor TaxID=1429438 RepID=W4LQW6_ENTF1|nr:MAG: hypothetical protein ETSY1_11555 [Candidatus Entotheonella factor]
MQRRILLRRGFYLGLLIALMFLPRGVDHGWAQAQGGDLELLKKQVRQLMRQEVERQQQIRALQKQEMERQQQIRALQEQIERLEAERAKPQPPQAPASALDRALEELPATPAPSTEPTAPSLVSGQTGGATFRLIDVSAIINMAVGGSTEPDSRLSFLQLGGHDPRQNGFTLQATEISLAGAVDPYFSGEVHLNFLDQNGETLAELEEAFLTTQALPFGLEVEAGLMLTEFGIINTQHSHSWDWQDQPIVASRMFGPDGQRLVGARLGWLVPVPWFAQLHIGVQNARSNLAPSFNGAFHMHGGGEEGGHSHGGEEEEETVVGQRPLVQQRVEGPEDMLYLVRLENSWELPQQITAKFGLSSLFGPNASGPDGRSIVAGADLKMTWRPARNFRGWPFLKWQSEFMWRDYKADDFQAEEPDEAIQQLDSDHLRGYGFYSQLLYGFRHGWAAGVRVEYANGEGNSVEGRSQDPLRDERFRLSPQLVYWPTEFSRLRLQYNYDWADHLDDNDAHTVWLGLEAQFGPHPAHQY